jgi:hypothetical protein
MTFLQRSLSVLFGALAVAGASAQTTYASREVAINAGVIYFRREPEFGGDNGVFRSAAPHVLYALDGDRAIKPAGWSFRNPRSGGVITDSMRFRWNGTPPPSGSKLTKEMAGYWEVPISDITESAIADYDFLVLSSFGAPTINSRDREKLRAFVDKGGVLWIDVRQSAVAADRINPAIVSFTLGPATGDIFYDFTSSLLRTPNEVTYDELVALRDRSGLAANVVSNLGALNDSQGWVRYDSQAVRSVVDVPGAGYLLATKQIGDGYVVVSSLGLDQALNRKIGPGGTFVPNNDFRSGKVVRDPYYGAAAKLVTNMLNLNSGFSGTARGSRKSSSSSVEVAAPQLRRQTVNIAPLGGTEVAHARNTVIVNTGSDLVVLDIDPQRDMDLDGNEDDGIQDPFAAQYDTLWSVAGNFVTTPSVCEVPGIGEVIVVGDASGQYFAYVLAQGNPNAPVQLYRTGVPGTGSGTKISSPTFHEGLGFVADTDSRGLGRIWAFDTVTGDVIQRPRGRRFVLENSGRLARPAGAPTVGYIPILDNSGGYDRVAYIPTQRDAALRRPAGMASAWIGARGESPVATFLNGSNLQITTRASLQGAPILNLPNSSLGLKISFVYNNSGRPVPESIVSQIVAGAPAVNVTQNGVIDLPVQNLGPATIELSGPSQNASVRVDYTLDWAAPVSGGPGAANSDQFVRGVVEFPDRTTPIRDVIGSVVLGQNGTVFVQTSPPAGSTDEGGSFFAMREEGRGSFTLVYRWELFDQLAYTVSGRPTIAYGPCLVDQDGILEIVQFGGNKILDQPLDSLKFVGSPVLRGNTVYLSVSAIKTIFGFPSPTSVILAMNADFKPAECVLSNLAANFILSQPDPARSDMGTPQSSFLQPGFYTYEQNTDLANKPGKLRIKSFMTATSGRVRDSLAINIPITIKQSGQSDIVVEPELAFGDGRFVPGSASGKWNPLRWYTVFNGIRFASNMVATGDTLYFGGPSLLPNIINTGNPFGPQRPFLGAMTLDVSPSDLISPDDVRPWMTGGITPRPWQRYLRQLNYAGSLSNLNISPYFVWPQFRGTFSFDDFRIRINQSTLTGNTLDGLVAGEGGLSAWGSGQLNTFTRGDFLIADQQRIMRVDSSGNPWWSSGRTLSAGAETQDSIAEIRTNLGQPQRAYSFEGNGYLVVDAGQNRIVRLDAQGNELRSIGNIRLDTTFRPDGVDRNPPLDLSQPHDVATYTSIKLAAQNPFTNAQPTEYWRHWLIADTGNKRMIEIVDRYAYDSARRRIGNVISFINEEGNSEKALGVLLWHVRTELAGRGYAYNSIGKTTIQDLGGNRKTVFAFGFGNVEPGTRSAGLDSNPVSVDSQSGNGGIVLYDPNSGSTEVVTKFNVPAINDDILWSQVDGAFTAQGRAGQTRKFSGLNSVTIQYEGTGQLSLTVADNLGVYKLIKNGANWEANFFLPQEVYTSIRRNVGGATISGENAREFRPTYAKQYRNGEMIIVNGYQGVKRNGNRLDGEVLLINTAAFDYTRVNFNLDQYAIAFELPPITGIRGLVRPVFADRP